MFNEIRYELNGAEIDRKKNVGIISIIKNYVSLTYDKALIMRNAGHHIDHTRRITLTFACRSTRCWAFARITNA